MYEKDIELTTGAVVRCRPVPPYALGPVYRSLPTPPIPKVTIPSAAGGSETHTALRESPEWEDFQAKMEEYKRRRTQLINEFHLDYGVVAWKLPGEEEFTNTPPDDWALPTIMTRYGVFIARDVPGRRLQFIIYGLIATDDDANKVDEVIASTQMLTKKEVEAALAPFVSNTNKVNSQ